MDFAEREKIFLAQLGKNISRLRKEKKLSQLDVCAIVNMEKSNLSAIENGRQNATALTLHKIAQAINVPIQAFFNL